MELNECINFLLTKAQNTVFQHFKARLAEFGVTPVQYGILSCLWKEDGQSPKQIAEKLSLDGSTITGILDRMERKKLLKRIPNPEDRRVVNVYLTEQGKLLKEPIEKTVDEANQKILNNLSKENQELLKNLLEQISRF